MPLPAAAGVALPLLLFRLPLSRGGVAAQAAVRDSVAAPERQELHHALLYA